MKLSPGSSIVCLGVVRESGGKLQATEMNCDQLKVLGAGLPELLPFAPKNRESMEWHKLRHWPHLRPRAAKISAMLRLRSNLITSIYTYMNQNEYYHISTPILTSNDCEGAGEMFKVESRACTDKNMFFGTNVYLTVSAQLHLESMAW